SGRLGLGAAAGAGAAALVGRLGAFCAAYPQVQLTLTAGEGGGRGGGPGGGGGRRGGGGGGRWAGGGAGAAAGGVGGGRRVRHAAPGRRRPPADGEAYPVLLPDALREQPLVLAGAGEGRAGGRREGLGALEERGLAGRDVRLALEVPGEGLVAAAVVAGAGV